MTSPFAGIDHVGYVVTDLDQALAFATDVLGFELVRERAGELADADSDTLIRRLGVHERATGTFRFLSAGNGQVEFLVWKSPDQSTEVARNSDHSGRHLAVKVLDMPAALEAIGAFPGVVIREPNERGYVYVKTPFGLEVQLIPVTGAAST